MDADLLAAPAGQADLFAIHSGGGGHAGDMPPSDVAIVNDGTKAADQRLALALTNDTALGVIRYAAAGYPDAITEADRQKVGHICLNP